MIKRLDKLVIQAFIGPFLVTVAVVTFIFTTQIIIKYLDELVGKDIGFANFAQLSFYFAINTAPLVLPLSLLISSLIAFGNLGEHFELTAIKSSGVSLTRILLPVFVFVLGLSVFSYWFGNSVVTYTHLKAYSLLYDISHKKPALDIREGMFYNGLPGYSIKVSKKYPDGQSLKDIIIYNHGEQRGNTTVTLADSGHMYTFGNDRYLAIELFKGKSYVERSETKQVIYPEKVTRSFFDKSKVIFSLESFQLKRTNEDLFLGHRYMKNMSRLGRDIDSFKHHIDSLNLHSERHIKPFYSFMNNPLAHLSRQNKAPKTYASLTASLKEFYSKAVGYQRKQVLTGALTKARSIKQNLEHNLDNIKDTEKNLRVFQITYWQKLTNPFSCIILFLIGAPLGAIIKKGGLGVPILISILFYIIYYVVSIMGEKAVKEGVLPMEVGMWAANVVLLPVGLFFLRQARNDSRVLEADAWKVGFQKIKKRLFFRK